jgi:hypothetical protein
MLGGEGEIMRIGRQLISTNSALREGGINYLRLMPANHHGAYYERIFQPNQVDAANLQGEIDGTHPLCSLCHKSRSNACIGHRIGIRLPFYMIQPHFATYFVKFLNAICLNINFDSEGDYSFSGCCSHRISMRKKGSIAAQLGNTPATCAFCQEKRQGGVKSFGFALGEYGGIAYLKAGNPVPISINAVMEYVSQDVFESNMLAASEFFGMQIDIRTLVTNTLYLTPYQLRANTPSQTNFETGMYSRIASMCAQVPYTTSPDSINVSAISEKHYKPIYQCIASLLASKPKTPEQETAYQHLPGKMGHVRQHITGAFTQNVGRGVVTPSDADIGVFKISRFYQALNTSETVNYYNLERVKHLARAGMVAWVQSEAGPVKYKPGMEIRLGHVVWRKLLGGDCVVANRQPTLHRLSLLGHHVKFAMNAVVSLFRSETTPYNADHDGDEMNLFPAPNPAAAFELASVAHACNNIQGPGMPAMAPVFHELAIMMIMSILVDEVVPNPEAYLAAYTQCLDLRQRIASYPARRRAVANSSGFSAGPNAPVISTFRDVCSLLFPEDFTYSVKGVVIRNGVLVKGEFGKDSIGLSTGSITHALSFYRRKRSALFVNDVARICDVYMTSNLVSFNPDDMIYSEEYYASIARVVNSVRPQLEGALQAKVRAKSEFEREELEKKISLLAAIPINHIMETISNDNKKVTDPKERVKNTFVIMYKSGCRGSTRTAMQMSMTLGIQYVGNDRVDATKFAWIRNPHAAKDEFGFPIQTVLGNGIIDNNFTKGLTPEQFAVHACPVRQSVVRGKMDVAATGHRSKHMTAIYGQFRIDQDLAVVSGKTVVSTSIGANIDPSTLVVIGDGKSSFIDPAVAVASVNFRLSKAALLANVA